VEPTSISASDFQLRPEGFFARLLARRGHSRRSEPNRCPVFHQEKEMDLISYDFAAVTMYRFPSDFALSDESALRNRLSVGNIR